MNYVHAQSSFKFLLLIIINLYNSKDDKRISQNELSNKKWSMMK